MKLRSAGVTSGISNLLLLFGLLLSVSESSSEVGHLSETTNAISGGIWFASTNSASESEQYNYNITQFIKSFNVQQIQYLINVPEVNFVYYALYNTTSLKNEIFRARPDGSNVQYVTTINSLHDDPYGRKGVVKFGIDVDNGYLYYAYGTNVYQALLTGVNPIVFTNYSPHIPTSVTYNRNNKTLGVLSSYTSSQYAITTYQYNGSSSWTNHTSYPPSPADFSIYNGAVAYTYGGNLYVSTYSYSISASNYSPIDYNWSNGALYFTNDSSIAAVNITGDSSLDYLVSYTNRFTDPFMYLSVEESSCPNDCDCKGDCVVQSGSTEGTCECISNYFSSDCSVYCTCYRGACNYDGICVCDEGYFGTTCNITCSSTQNCSGNGYCVTVGAAAGCVCYDGYIGVNCSVKELPSIPFSGGIISKPYGGYVVNASVFNWNFTQSSNTFPFANPNYILIDPNTQYIYFSVYITEYSCYQLFRANPDGSNIKFITNMSQKWNSYEVQKFSFDVDYKYIYFPFYAEIFRYSLENETVELFHNFHNYEFAIYSISVDTATNNIWFSTSAEVRCITLSIQDCSTTTNSFEDIADFVVYNSTVFLIQIHGYSKSLCFIKQNGSFTKYNADKYTYIESCNCLTIDPTLLRVYYSTNEEILSLTISSDLQSFSYSNSGFYLPYANGESNGVAFLSYTPSSCAMDCTANGDCMVEEGESQEGECVCYENYYSSDCSVFCNDEATCSNNGVCTEEGGCDCDDGYYSYNCGCNPEITCSGSGNCTSSGSCSCFEYSSGPSCTPIIPNPVVPSTFFCTSYFSSNENQTSIRIDMSISEPNQERRFDQFNADGDIERSIIQKFIFGTQYNITYNPEQCLTEDLSTISFSSFEVPAGARLTYFNGTVGSCVKNAVEVWSTSTVKYTYVQICESSSSSSSPGFYSVPYQIFWIEQNNYLEFNLDSYQFSVPSSNYTLPSFC